MKNKKMIHKLLSLILIVSITLCFFNITGNAYEKTQIDIDTVNKINKHIEQTLPGYLKTSNLWDLAVTISEPMAIHDWNEEVVDYGRYLCFVINNKNIIGKLTIAECDGEIISSFDIGNLDEINKMFSDKTPVTFGSYENCLIMQSESESIILHGLDNDDNLLNDISLYNETSLITETKAKSFRATPATRVGNTQLNVPFTYNQWRNGAGICWAACIASKVRYHYGNAEVVNGYDLHPAMGAYAIYALVSGVSGNPTPIGVEPYIQYGYNKFYISTIGTGSLSAQGVENILVQGKPIHIGIDSSIGRHGILICGAELNTTSGFYKIMDPNVNNSYVYSYVDQNAMYNGSKYKYMAPDGTIYNNWYESRY